MNIADIFRRNETKPNISNMYLFI